MAAPKDRKVHVLIVSHRHDKDYHVTETEELAYQLLHAYVKEWWNDGAETPEMPKKRDRAIEMYFDKVREDEYYEIEECSITTASNIRRHEKGLK
jgi:hypothetical protein